MNDIKIKLIELEKKFYKMRDRTEKYYKIFLVLYFIPPAIAILLLSKHFQELLNIYTKTALFAIIVIGVIIHFFIRNRLHVSKNKYKNFVKSGLNEICPDGIDQKMTKKIVESAKIIFAERGIQFSNISINNQLFWHIIFLNLGIEINEDFL